VAAWQISEARRPGYQKIRIQDRVKSTMETEMQKPKLSQKDHKAMDAMLGDLLEAFKNGELSETTVSSGLAHIMAALDLGNTQEAVMWFKQQDLKFFRENEKHLSSIGITSKKSKPTKRTQ
jgi:hypothetical protein